MSQNLTVEIFEKSINGLEERLTEKVTAIVTRAVDQLALSTGKGFAAVDEQFKEVKAEMRTMNSRLSNVEIDLKDTKSIMTAGFKHVVEKLDYFASDHNHRIAALEDKMKIVSLKLGLQS